MTICAVAASVSADGIEDIQLQFLVHIVCAFENSGQNTMQQFFFFGLLGFGATAATMA